MVARWLGGWVAGWLGGWLGGCVARRLRGWMARAPPLPPPTPSPPLTETGPTGECTKQKAAMIGKKIDTQKDGH